MNDFPNMQTHEPMDVTLSKDGSSSFPEPPLDPTWSNLDRLRWKAGNVTRETGLYIRIRTGGSFVTTKNGERIEVKDAYALQVGKTSGTSMPFHNAWDYLSGVATGHRETLRDTDSDDDPCRHEDLWKITDMAGGVQATICKDCGGQPTHG